MNRNRSIRYIISILSITALLASGTCAYAFDNGTYHDFRDGEVSLYLPDSWSSEEIDAGESKGKACEKIAHAWDDESSGTLDLEIYFMADEVKQDEYIYFDDDEEGALEYYSDYGIDAMDDAFLQWMEEDGETMTASWEILNEEFFDGEWNGFMVVDLTGSAEYDAAETEGTEEVNPTVYLTAGMTDDDQIFVHNVLVFSREDGTALNEAEKELAQEIADEFYDYNYDNVMTGAEGESLLDSGSGSDDGIDMDGVGDILMDLLLTGLPLAIAIAGVVVAIRNKRQKKKNKGRDFGSTASPAFAKPLKEMKKAQQTFASGDTLGKWKKRRGEKNQFSRKEQRAEQRAGRREQRAERRTEWRTERRSTMQMRTREAESAEQRYYESLKTLLGTGLLTKEEMRDMLERHERSRARQQRR